MDKVHQHTDFDASHGMGGTSETQMEADFNEAIWLLRAVLEYPYLVSDDIPRKALQRFVDQFN